MRLSGKIVCLLLLAMSNITVKAGSLAPQQVPLYNMSQYDAAISELLTTQDNRPITERLIRLSKIFLEKPYLLGALGEGVKGQYDQNPLYRTDAFDCVTYVSTVLALAHSKNLTEFKQNITAINYKNGKPVFRERNHFMSVDWNRNNQRKGYVQDITNKITDTSGKPLAVIATALIDRPNWFENLKMNQLKLIKKVSTVQADSLLKQLHAEAHGLQPEYSHLPYVPLKKLFPHGKADAQIFAQIPSGSIIEIVRPNWALKELIGTNLNVSHLGFAIRTPQGLMFREASSEKGKIIDIPLTTYLKKYLTSTTVKGINVQRIRENIEE